MASIVERLRGHARQLRALYADADGTSLHLCAADDADESATTIEMLVEALEFARAEIEVLNKGDSPSIKIIDAAIAKATGAA